MKRCCDRIIVGAQRGATPQVAVAQRQRKFATDQARGYLGLEAPSR